MVHVDSGIVKLERDGPVEFQHPYFKQGREDLLEHIKRKVSEKYVEVFYIYKWFQKFREFRLACATSPTHEPILDQ